MIDAYPSDQQSPNGPPWPTNEQYALAHPCWRCGAQPGEACNAPRKQGRSHALRQDAGSRHYSKDRRNAPWREDRLPGSRYGTVPDEILRRFPSD